MYVQLKIPLEYHFECSMVCNCSFTSMFSKARKQVKEIVAITMTNRKQKAEEFNRLLCENKATTNCTGVVLGDRELQKGVIVLVI